MSPPQTLPAATLTLTNELAYRRSFRAMNTDVTFLLVDWLSDGRASEAEAYFHAFESRFSRFLPESELSRLNQRRGLLVQLSRPMRELLLTARRLNRLTRGVFEPAILAQLEAAGYDRSFELLEDRGAEPAPSPRASRSLREMRLLRQEGLALLPLGLRLDFGGIGKGYAVDNAARILRDTGGFLIDAGGDIYAGGRGPTGRPWRVAVTDPDDGHEIEVVELVDAAIATSTTRKRRWQRGGAEAHHLIDPRTQLPAETGISSATVIAPSTAVADVFAKAAVILGVEQGSALLDAHHCSGLFVLADGEVIRTSRWPRFGQGKEG
ncbi:MAG TPA: FAD:protein FMN transferase [Dehalococcoidia bacterium]|nr:FAD:protein FMN transferase [Dehalococcoidia bacterium]